jgi:hypothetical protein
MDSEKTFGNKKGDNKRCLFFNDCLEQKQNM